MAGRSTWDRCAPLALCAEAGAPWHTQDNDGYTAGEYASGSGHRDILELLLDWAVRAELILGGYGRMA